MGSGIHPDDFDTPGPPVQLPQQTIAPPPASAHVQAQSPPISTHGTSQQSIPRTRTLSSPSPPAGAGNYKWVGVVVAVLIGALLVWKLINRPTIVATPTASAPSVQFIPLEGRIIGALSPTTSVPGWLQSVAGSRAISADNYPPPENYQIRDRCAGEGCSYQRQWRALKEVPLFAAWDQPGSERVYVLSNHESATALTGVWITKVPAVFEVQRPIAIAGVGLQSGDLAYGFMYLGEGFMRGFFHGKIADFSLEGPSNQPVVRKLRDYESMLWVQMRTGTGTTGWTSEGAYPSFDGQSESSGGAPYLLVHEGQEQNGLWEYEVEVFSQGRPASIKLGQETTPLPKSAEIQRVRTGFVIPPGEMQGIDLVANDTGELLAKTFVRPGTAPRETAAPSPPSPSPAAIAKPSFNCAVATTPTERLICKDPELASAEVQMVSAHDQLANQLSGAEAAAFRTEHLEWFKNWSRTCNAIGKNEPEPELRACIARFLSNRIEQLRARIK